MLTGEDEREAFTRDWVERVRSAWDVRAASWEALSEANAASPDRVGDLARIAAALQLGPGRSVLDAGCGTGHYAAAFADMGCQVTAVDLSPEMIARARQRHAHLPIEIDWRVGDITSIDLPDASFDAIHARVVLQFVADPAQALIEFRRVLMPEGRLLVSVPGALSPIYNRSWRRFIEPGPAGNTHIVPWELEALLDNLGWRRLDGWGEQGGNLAGHSNPLSAEAVQALPLPLRQAAATTWTIVCQP